MWDNDENEAVEIAEQLCNGLLWAHSLYSYVAHTWRFIRQSVESDNNLAIYTHIYYSFSSLFFVVLLCRETVIGKLGMLLLK